MEQLRAGGDNPAAIPPLTPLPAAAPLCPALHAAESAQTGPLHPPKLLRTKGSWVHTHPLAAPHKLL